MMVHKHLRRRHASIVWREDGASFAEYAVALALVAIVTLAALSLLGANFSSALAGIAGSI
jgi:Flp pilus assembly pilin Flp